MAPSRPPVDLSQPLPSSTAPAVTQADLEALLAAIEDLKSRLSAKADDGRAPSVAATAVDIEASVAAAIGDLEPRLSASVDGKLRAAFDEVRSRLPDGETLSGLTRALEANRAALENCRESDQAVRERMAGDNETLERLVGLLKSFTDTQGKLAEQVSRLADAQVGALERLEEWKRNIPADIETALSRDGARETGEVVRLAERFTTLEAGLAAQRTDLAAVREAVTTTGEGTTETLRGIETALDGAGGGIRNLDIAFRQFKKMADLHQTHLEKGVGSLPSRLRWIFWPVLFVFAHEVYRFIVYRLGVTLPF